MTSADIREKGERAGFEILDIKQERKGYLLISSAAGRAWAATM